MTQQQRFSLLRRILICVQLYNWISVSLIEASEISLTQNELRNKYGQGMDVVIFSSSIDPKLFRCNF